MEKWRRAWRLGIMPLLSKKARDALHKAVKENSPDLIQGKSTVPDIFCSDETKPEACCVLAYTGWRGEGLETVQEIMGYCKILVDHINRSLPHDVCVGDFVQWYDSNPREVVLAELRGEFAWHEWKENLADEDL